MADAIMNDGLEVDGTSNIIAKKVNQQEILDQEMRLVCRGAACSGVRNTIQTVCAP